MQYKKYRIQATDTFNPDDFPKVVAELEDLNQVISNTKAAYKKEILISFLKRNELKSSLYENDSELIYLITSGAFVTVHLQSLFDSCDNNEQFQWEYENYLRENIS